MNVLRRPKMVSFVSLVTMMIAAPTIAHAGDTLATKVRAAWEKLSECEEAKTSYGERATIAITMLDLDRERVMVEAEARELKVEVDGFPARRNNLQNEVFQELRSRRQRIADIDQQLRQLRLQWQELNEAAILEAQQAGKRVKPLDRPGLLHELQRLDRECQTNFESLRNALPESARTLGVTEYAAFNQAMDDVGKETGSAFRLLPAKQFRAAFKDYYDQKSPRSKKKPGRMYGKTRSAR